MSSSSPTAALSSWCGYWCVSCCSPWLTLVFSSDKLQDTLGHRGAPILPAATSCLVSHRFFHTTAPPSTARSSFSRRFVGHSGFRGDGGGEADKVTANRKNQHLVRVEGTRRWPSVSCQPEESALGHGLHTPQHLDGGSWWRLAGADLQHRRLVLRWSDTVHE